MANDFLKMVEKRRSIRRFNEKEIAHGDVAKILKAALGAPSSKNCRSSSFMVVETPELIEKISLMRDSGSAFVKDAPMVILVMGDDTVTDLWEVNASISATYLQLAAESLGMGSCWVHVAGRPRVKAEPDGENAGDYLRTFLPVPAGRRILCAVALGYPASTDLKPLPVKDEEDKVITV